VLARASGSEAGLRANVLILERVSFVRGAGGVVELRHDDRDEQGDRHGEERRLVVREDRASSVAADMSSPAIASPFWKPVMPPPAV
jgi:hypothetical protein